MKKKSYAAATFLGILATLAAILAGTGCESTEEVSVAISPSYVELGVGDSVTLAATGWHTYRWSLSASSGGSNGTVSASTVNGSLSSTTGERVVYRALQGSGSTIYCYAVASSGQTEVIAPGHATIVHK